MSVKYRNKKEKEMIEKVLNGTYETESDLRMKMRNANLRKQQTEAQDIAPVKATKKDNDIAPTNGNIFDKMKKIGTATEGVMGNLLMGIEGTIPKATKFATEVAEYLPKKVTSFVTDKILGLTTDLNEEQRKATANILTETVSNLGSTKSIIDNSTVGQLDNTLNTEKMENWRKETIQENTEKAKEGGVIGEWTNDLMLGLGDNLIPTVLFFVPGGQLLSAGLSVTSAGGSYLEDAEQRGMNEDEKMAYSSTMAVWEGGGDWLQNLAFGKLFKLFGAGDFFTKEVGKSLLGNVALGAGQEGATEYVQEGVADLAGGYGDWDNIHMRALRSASIGGANALLLGGGANGIVTATYTINVNNNTTQAIKTAEQQLGRTLTAEEQTQIKKQVKEYTKTKMLDTTDMTAEEKAEIERISQLSNEDMILEAVQQVVDSGKVDVDKVMAGVEEAVKEQTQAPLEQRIGDQTQIPTLEELQQVREEKIAEQEQTQDTRLKGIIQEELQVIDEEINNIQQNAQQITNDVVEAKPITNDNKGREVPKELQEKLKDVKTVDEKGNVKTYYHGTRGKFDKYDNSKIGQNYEGDWSILGKGFYFTENYDEAKEFGESSINEGEVNVREEYLAIKNPFYNDMAQNDSQVLEELKEKYNLEDTDFSNGYNLIRVLRSKGVDTTEVLKEYGYDGIITEDEAVVFDSESIIDPKKQEIVQEEIKPEETKTPVQDAKIEENASYKKQDAPVQVKTEINKNGVQMSVGEQIRTFNNSTYEVTDLYTTDDGVVRAKLKDNKGYETGIGIDAIAENLSDPTKNNVSTRIENDSLKSSEAVETQNTEAFDNITDNDAPTFEESVADVFDEVGETDIAPTVESPLQDRNIEDVGNRKVKAYQYENPEVRPYFQAEAENMLYDLENTVKGERIVTKQYNPVTGLYENAGYTGTTRQTAEAIAYLKDVWGYSYAEIEKGLNNIIKDDGAENNAVSKRIEFLLDERLREGYTTSDGTPIPANEDYIKFLEERQITEYNSQAIDSLAVDENVPNDELSQNSLQNMEEVIKYNSKDSTYITVAPYYNTQLTSENFESIKNAVDKDFKETANKFSSLLGAKVENVSTNIGGFTFQQGETAGQFVKELSYTFELKNTNSEDADVIASLLGDLGHEQQEAVISANYLDITSTEADALEFRVGVKDINGVEEALNKAGINDYTIDTTDNSIKILEFDLENPENTVSNLELLVKELGGNYNGFEESKIQSRYLDREARQDLYKKWLATHETNEQNRELNNYISRALQEVEQKLSEELDNSSFFNAENLSETQEVIEDVAPVENVPQNPNTEAVEGKQRSWVKTSTESNALEGKIQISDLDIEKANYIPITNKDTLGKANAKINSLGYEKAVESFKSFVLSGKRVTAVDTTMGQRLIQEALKRGDKDTAIDLLQDVAILETEAGQVAQSGAIIQKMTPAGQLKMLEKIVNRAKVRGDKAFENVELTDEMRKKVLDTFNDDGITYDQDRLNKTMDEVKQEIADQIQTTNLDKINAWRYLAMLGNPKTHLRNLVSNTAMWGTTEVKNAVARTIETVAPIKERTKTWKPSSEEVKNFANQTAIEMKEIISGDNKYNDETGIKNLARTFENEVLEKVYNFNNDLLQKEDWWFSGARFKKSLSEFLTANNINTQEDILLNPELVEKAKTYALEQSRIATFRQASYLANKIREIENKNVATNIAVGSIIPFKKTPINVAKTGLAYSPLGFAKTLTYDIAKVKKGDMDASTLVDHLAQNTVGTALTLVGYMLAMSGFLSGAGGDDEEAKYDYQLGKQAYAINIDGKSYSLSWLSPVAMPLFVGANAYSQLVEGKEWNGDVVVETLAQTLDPLNEMSFLSSLTNVLSSYETGTQKFAGMFETMAQSYATQFIPTASSQLAGTIDDTKRTTKVASDSGFKFIDETINKLIYKIPILRETLEPTTDIWGNEVKQSENVLQRAYENFISPYARKESTATEIDENIKEVFNATGDNGVIPNVPKNTIKFDNETYKMTAKEYTTYKQTYGQTANDLLEDLFRTTTYKTAGAEEKADMINDVYDYASDIAKKEQLVKDGVNYTNATEDGEKVYRENLIKKAIEHDMLVDEYKLYEENPDKHKFLQDNNISFKEYDSNRDEYNYAFENPSKYKTITAITDYNTYTTYSKDLYNLKADKDEYGKSISGSRKEKVIEYVNSLDIGGVQRAMLYKMEYPSDNSYNYEIVEYVNNLDLDFSDKKAILEELEMRVDKEGNIYWD